MKFGIISDIHGNYPALCQVLRVLRGCGCTRVINLGDTVGYYPMINECISLLLEEGVFSLKGNHDSYLLGESICPRSRSVMDCIRYQQSIIRPELRDWLATLRPASRTTDFYAVHGGWRDPLDEYIAEFDFEGAWKWGGGCRFFFSGHTHVQRCEGRDGLWYCNPGSVGQPRDHDPRAAYAVWENGAVTLGRTEYDIDETAAGMQAAGFSDYYYRNLYKGCRIGE